MPVVLRPQFDDGFNTEHTFPQSFFSQNLPMRSDLFHIFPTLATANSERANFPFGVVSQASGSLAAPKEGEIYLSRGINTKYGCESHDVFCASV